jgi:hypothetical protein
VEWSGRVRAKRAREEEGWLAFRDDYNLEKLPLDITSTLSSTKSQRSTTNQVNQLQLHSSNYQSYF